MKKKIQLLIAFALVFGFGAYAQQQRERYETALEIEKQYPGDETAKKVYDTAFEKQQDPKTSAVRTSWLANRPKDNWFISVGAGASVLMSEETRYLDFGDQLSYPTFQLSVGKWFSPVWGLRINANYAKELNGFATWGDKDREGYEGWGLGHWYIGKNHPFGNTNPTNTYLAAYGDRASADEVYRRFLEGNKRIETKDHGWGYMYYTEYASVSVDFMVNLKHLFRPYNHKGFFNPVLYAGVGYAHTFGDKDRDVTAINNVMGKGGLQFNFRLCDSWDLFLDAQMQILPENFDHRVGDNQTVDAIASAHLGFTYRFNFRHFIKADIVNQKEIDKLLMEMVCPEVECPPVVCPPIPEPEPEPFYLTPVFFTLDSYVVRDNQWMSIAKAAEYLYENPKARLEIAGYADKNTGNPAHNMKLSENRSKAVVKVLVEKFGIDANRLEVTFYGDKVQPFEENDWNRVAIFVLP